VTALLIAVSSGICSACVGVASAEEYYSIGMAYYDLGKYTEAERWLARARTVQKTKHASEYQLGRISFDAKRYSEALHYFESILASDPDNVMALRAAAYTNIELGDSEGALEYYRRVLAKEPESADDGYNYALVLYAVGYYREAEGVLARYPHAIRTNEAIQLLCARVLQKQQKPEALNYYALYLESKSDPTVHFEYAETFEEFEMYARALEEYRKLLNSDSQSKDGNIQFALARTLLKADPSNEETATALKAALERGIERATVEALLEDSQMDETARSVINHVLRGENTEEDRV
jgi:tetratricopeptide (TPR) repeat protein